MDANTCLAVCVIAVFLLVTLDNIVANICKVKAHKNQAQKKDDNAETL